MKIVKLLEHYRGRLAEAEDDGAADVACALREVVEDLEALQALAVSFTEEANRELAGGGFTPDYEPTWHPYYWLGRRKMAEEVMADDGVRRGDGQPGSDRAAR